MHTLVHHARREILLTHPFMIVGQIQVALVVETKLALRTRIEKTADQYSHVNTEWQSPLSIYDRDLRTLYPGPSLCIAHI